MPEITGKPHSYEGGEEFWQKYIRGRPQIPKSLFERVSEYHASHGGSFSTAHDVGAGAGVHSAALHEHFSHVIVSDLIEQNVQTAEQRLGKEGYSYRAKPIEDASDMEAESVDLVFAATMLHFADLDRAYPAIDKQLKSNGTFAVLCCGHPQLEDEAADAIWMHMWHRGIRLLLDKTQDPEMTLRVFGRVGSGYDTIPLDDKIFLPGALRVRMNHDRWSVTCPEDIQKASEEKFGGYAIRSDEQILNVVEPGLLFKTNMEGLRQTAATYSFARLDPALFDSDWKELESIVGDKEIGAKWAARLILATKR